MWLPGEVIPSAVNALPGSLMRGTVVRRTRLAGLGAYGAGPDAGSGINFDTPQRTGHSSVICKPPLVPDKYGKACLCPWPNVQTPRGCRPPPSPAPPTRPDFRPAPTAPQPPPAAPGCPVCQVCPTCPPARDCPACDGMGACPGPEYIKVPGDCPAPEGCSTGKLWLVALAGGIGAMAVALVAAKMTGAV